MFPSLNCCNFYGENSISKSEQIQELDQRTTEGAEDQKVSFHGTKGCYYDEYHHQIYQHRIKHQDHDCQTMSALYCVFFDHKNSTTNVSTVSQRHWISWK
eukprot:637581_1